MARSRRGSFGLQPRVVPNVTSQIVALAREYVAKRDSLIMDAWRNGGTFEGKKVTDDQVLAYWKEREKGLDQGDPDYEQAKDNIMQLQYGIAQSKADVLHTQGKMSDQQYAQFFLNWAKKVPHNSEFYRTLQKDAAQLIEQGKASAHANAERAKTEAFNSFVQKTTDSDIAIGDALTKALTDMSKATGLSVTGNGDELLSMLTQDISQYPDKYRALLDTIKKGDPHWDGQVTEGYFTAHLKSAVDGYSLIADRAQKGGFVSAYASATNGMASMTAWGQNVKAWPDATSYTQVMNGLYSVWNDPTASEPDKIAAASSAAAQLNQIAATPGIDAGVKSMIQADAMRLMGQDAGDAPSFGTSMLGRNGVTPELAQQVGALVQIKQQMDANPAGWAYAPVDKNGNFDPTGQGAIGMVPAGQVQPGAVAVMVPGRDGKAVMAMMPSHAVYGVNPDDPNAAPVLIGHVVSYNAGSRQISIWGYRDQSGQPQWSLVSPVADNATTSIDNKGDVYVTPQASVQADPMAQAKAIDAQYGTNLAAQMQYQIDHGSSSLDGVSVSQFVPTDPKHPGVASQTLTLTYRNGKFVATTTQHVKDPNTGVTVDQTSPVTMPLATQSNSPLSPSRLSAGTVPGVTYTSPMLASVTASAYTQTADQVSKFTSDPSFVQNWLSQTMQTLGTNNPADPRVAAAWAQVTQARASEHITPTPQNAALRADLRYPGENINPNAYQGSLQINYGGQSLTVPGLPSYLGQQTISGPNSPDTWQRAASAGYGLANPMLPSVGVPQTPAGTPAVAAPVIPKPTTISTGPGAVPTNMPGVAPIPTSAPAPTSAPSPTPVTKPGQAPKPF